MNCEKCGMPLNNEDQFCKSCGTPVNRVNVQPVQSVETNNLNSFQSQNYNNMNQDLGNINPSPINNGMGSMNSAPINNGVESMNSVPNNNENNMSYVPNQLQNNQMPVQQPSNSSKNNLATIIIGVVAIIGIVVLAIVLVPKLINNGNNGGDVAVETGSSYKVSYKGFSFRIPDNLVYEVKGDELLIGDEESTWIVELYITDQNFNYYKNNKAYLQNYFQQNGFTASPAELKTLGGFEFVTIELENGGMKAIGAYGKINSMNSVWFVGYNVTNTIDYDIIKKMGPVISSIKQEDVASNVSLESKFNFDVSGMNQLEQYN